jgi:hypothetical protein
MMMVTDETPSKALALAAIWPEVPAPKRISGMNDVEKCKGCPPECKA